MAGTRGLEATEAFASGEHEAMRHEPEERDVAAEAVFLVACQGDEQRVFGPAIEALAAEGAGLRIVCCGRSAAGSRDEDRAFIARCKDLGARQEEIVFAYGRSLPGTFSPWPWAEQLDALLCAMPARRVFARSPARSMTSDRDARALGLAALLLRRTGRIADLVLVGREGGDGVLSVTDGATLSFEQGAQEWTDDLVAEAVGAQSAADAARAGEIAGELDALRRSKAFKLGNALAAPWRRLHGA